MPPHPYPEAKLLQSNFRNSGCSSGDTVSLEVLDKGRGMSHQTTISLWERCGCALKKSPGTSGGSLKDWHWEPGSVYKGTFERGLILICILFSWKRATSQLMNQVALCLQPVYLFPFSPSLKSEIPFHISIVWQVKTHESGQEENTCEAAHIPLHQRYEERGCSMAGGP